MANTNRRCMVMAVMLCLGTLTGCVDNSPGAARSAAPGAQQLAAPGKAVSDQEIPKLDVGMIGDAPTFDPTIRSNIGTYIAVLGMESLLRISSDGELGPWLATDWEQKSDTVYEYTLRKGVKFWDGTELTSQDVKYSWDYLRRPESRRANFYSSVKSVDAPDRYTVRVTLKQPDASWKYTPAMYYSVVFQKKFAEAHRGTFGQPGTLMVATGPWKFDRLNPTSGVELSANADYWGGKPPIERISVKFFKDDNSMALALRAGAIDLTPMVNGPKGFDAAAGGAATTTVPTCGTALLSLPTRTAPWDDVHVRRAVAHALNRQEIIAATQGRAGGPMDTLTSPILLRSLGTEAEVEAALKTVPTYPHDLGKAKEELAKSKVPDGFSATISAYQGSTEIVQVIAAQLKQIGIDLEIEPLVDSAWFANITGPAANRPLTFSETGGCTPDPSWNDLWLGSKNLGKGLLNVANYAPAEVDRLLADGLATQDPKQRLEIYTKVLRQLGEDVPYVPVYAEGTTYASTGYDLVGYGSYWFSSPWILNVKPR
jgi:peptide/nickel transport system substrate-binding protein